MSQLITQLKNSISYGLYRRRTSLSQKEAGKKLGLKSPAIVSRWEKGLATPTLINICKLLLLYNITFEELFFDLLNALREQYPELTNRSHIASNITYHE